MASVLISCGYTQVFGRKSHTQIAGAKKQIGLAKNEREELCLV